MVLHLHQEVACAFVVMCFAIPRCQKVQDWNVFVAVVLLPVLAAATGHNMLKERL